MQRFPLSGNDPSQTRRPKKSKKGASNSVDRPPPPTSLSQSTTTAPIRLSSLLHTLLQSAVSTLSQLPNAPSVAVTSSSSSASASSSSSSLGPSSSSSTTHPNSEKLFSLFARLREQLLRILVLSRFASVTKPLHTTPKLDAFSKRLDGILCSFNGSAEFLFGTLRGVACGSGRVGRSDVEGAREVMLGERGGYGRRFPRDLHFVADEDEKDGEEDGDGDVEMSGPSMSGGISESVWRDVMCQRLREKFISQRGEILRRFRVEEQVGEDSESASSVTYFLLKVPNELIVKVSLDADLQWIVLNVKLLLNARNYHAGAFSGESRMQVLRLAQAVLLETQSFEALYRTIHGIVVRSAMDLLCVLGRSLRGIVDVVVETPFRNDKFGLKVYYWKPSKTKMPQQESATSRSRGIKFGKGVHPDHVPLFQPVVRGGGRGGGAGSKVVREVFGALLSVAIDDSGQRLVVSHSPQLLRGRHVYENDSLRFNAIDLVGLWTAHAKALVRARLDAAVQVLAGERIVARRIEAEDFVEIRIALLGDFEGTISIDWQTGAWDIGILYRSVLLLSSVAVRRRLSSLAERGDGLRTRHRGHLDDDFLMSGSDVDEFLLLLRGPDSAAVDCHQEDFANRLRRQFERSLYRYSCHLHAFDNDRSGTSTAYLRRIPSVVRNLHCDVVVLAYSAAAGREGLTVLDQDSSFVRFAERMDPMDVEFLRRKKGVLFIQYPIVEKDKERVLAARPGRIVDREEERDYEVKTSIFHDSTYIVLWPVPFFAEEEEEEEFLRSDSSVRSFGQNEFRWRLLAGNGRKREMSLLQVWIEPPSPSTQEEEDDDVEMTSISRTRKRKRENPFGDVPVPAAAVGESSLFAAVAKEPKGKRRKRVSDFLIPPIPIRDDDTGGTNASSANPFSYETCVLKHLVSHCRGLVLKNVLWQQLALNLGRSSFYPLPPARQTRSHVGSRPRPIYSDIGDVLRFCYELRSPNSGTLLFALRVDPGGSSWTVKCWSSDASIFDEKMTFDGNQRVEYSRTEEEGVLLTFKYSDSDFWDDFAHDVASVDRILFLAQQIRRIDFSSGVVAVEELSLWKLVLRFGLETLSKSEQTQETVSMPVGHCTIVPNRITTSVVNGWTPYSVTLSPRNELERMCSRFLNTSGNLSEFITVLSCPVVYALYLNELIQKSWVVVPRNLAHLRLIHHDSDLRFDILVDDDVTVKLISIPSGYKHSRKQEESLKELFHSCCKRENFWGVREMFRRTISNALFLYCLELLTPQDSRTERLLVRRDVGEYELLRNGITYRLSFLLGYGWLTIEIGDGSGSILVNDAGTLSNSLRTLLRHLTLDTAFLYEKLKSFLSFLHLPYLTMLAVLLTADHLPNLELMWIVSPDFTPPPSLDRLVDRQSLRIGKRTVQQNDSALSLIVRVRDSNDRSCFVDLPLYYDFKKGVAQVRWISPNHLFLQSVMLQFPLQQRDATRSAFLVLCSALCSTPLENLRSLQIVVPQMPQQMQPALPEQDVIVL